MSQYTTKKTLNLCLNIQQKQPLINVTYKKTALNVGHSIQQKELLMYALIYSKNSP